MFAEIGIFVFEFLEKSRMYFFKRLFESIPVCYILQMVFYLYIYGPCRVWFCGGATDSESTEYDK